MGSAQANHQGALQFVSRRRIVNVHEQGGGFSMAVNAGNNPVVPHKLVAFAKDRYLTGSTRFGDPANLPYAFDPAYGQDITFGVGRAAPGRQDVGKTPLDLVPKMQKLLNVFAAGDTSGMAKRLFSKFTGRQSQVTYFEDIALNNAAARHQNIDHFCHAALSAPTSMYKSGLPRIHQALRAMKWDIKKVVAPTDLGVPAFNIGSKAFSSGDFNNGLGVMINGVQYVYVYATHYDCDGNRYGIRLKYIFYDVFGLDDDDLREFGAATDSWASTVAAIGITAWWQLQHQHGHAPLVTRIIINKDFESPAT
jgi:hypothetical protein